MAVSSSYWHVILRDWYNDGAIVTITLRSGKQFTGTVSASMWGNAARGEGLVSLIENKVSPVGHWGSIEVKHDMDIDDIVAITATPKTRG